MKYSPENIVTLQPDEVFVFGSNVFGKHCSGAARIAMDRFGAVWGKGVGRQGQSYAIPTMEGNIEVLKMYVDDFLQYASHYPKTTFLVTRIGCGIAGYKDSQIAPMFARALTMENVLLPKSFLDCLVKGNGMNDHYVEIPDMAYEGMKYTIDYAKRRHCHLTLPPDSMSWARLKGEYVFFWKDTDDSPYVTEKCLSQWYYAPFLVNGQWYNCAEQFMMAEKARLFGDYEIERQILAQADQMTIKKLGRMVRNFDESVWRKHRTKIIKQGNLAKFSQNPQLRDFLLATGETVLVEASPNDVIWGIGLAKENADATNPARWRGLNLLGFTLMEVRDELRKL